MSHENNQSNTTSEIVCLPEPRAGEKTTSSKLAPMNNDVKEFVVRTELSGPNKISEILAEYTNNHMSVKLFRLKPEFFILLIRGLSVRGRGNCSNSCSRKTTVRIQQRRTDARKGSLDW